MDKTIPNGVMIQITNKSDKRFNELGIICGYSAPYYSIISFNSDPKWIGSYSVNEFSVVSRKLWLEISLITPTNYEYDSEKYYVDNTLFSNNSFDKTIYQCSLQYKYHMYISLKDYMNENHSEFKKYFIDPNLDDNEGLKKGILDREQEVVIPKKDITVYYKISDSRIEEL